MIIRQRSIPGKQLQGICLFLKINLPFLLVLFLFGCAVKPEPFETQTLKKEVIESREHMFAWQVPVTRKVTLYEAMARAISYNLDHQVKRVEHALSVGNLELAKYELLPALTAGTYYSKRNNENGSSSKSLLTGVESLEVSTSQEKEHFSANITYVWNILDFGVGYTQAMQMADETLISEEWRRKAIQNIIQDVRFAFWKAAHAQQLLPEMDELLRVVEKALERSRKMKEKKVQNPAKILEYQQELLETVQHLWTMRKDLSLAKIELAALMNLEPGTQFELDFPGIDHQKVEQILSIGALEEFALTNRPEIWIESYNKRISAKEIKKEMLGMLPGFDINLNANYDDNTYLFNNNWLEAGLSLSWNVFKLLTGPKALDRANIRKELSDKLYQATIMMVLTQVHLAHQSYYVAMKDYQITSQLDTVLQNKLRYASSAQKAMAGNRQEVIRSQVAALSARMNKGLAYAQLQGAMGKIFNTTGMDPLPARIKLENLDTLAQFIKGHEQGLLSKFQVKPLTSDGLPSETISGQSGTAKKHVKSADKSLSPSAVFKPVLADPGLEYILPQTSAQNKALKGTEKRLDMKSGPLKPVISEEQKKQYQKAYDFFYEHFRTAPDSRNVNFLLGKSAYGMGDYEAAVMAFERVLIIDPDAVEMKLEIAKSYIALGSYKIATDYLDEVLASGAQGPVSDEARMLSDQIAAAGLREQ